MKVELITYDHASNGITLQVIPETDAERQILDGLWKHGEMDQGYGDSAFSISWKIKEKTGESE